MSHLRLGIKPSGTHAANAPHAQRTFVLEVSTEEATLLQPYAQEAATLCAGGYNHMCRTRCVSYNASAVIPHKLT